MKFYEYNSELEILEQTAMKYEEEFSQYSNGPDIGAVYCFCTNKTNEVTYDKNFKYLDRGGVE